MPGPLQGTETEEETTNTVCFGRKGDFLIPLPRLPKSENVAVDNSKDEIQIFLGQDTIYIFLLMGFRAFLESSFSKVQNMTEVRIKVYNWKARGNSLQFGISQHCPHIQKCV